MGDKANLKKLIRQANVFPELVEGEKKTKKLEKKETEPFMDNLDEIAGGFY